MTKTTQERWLAGYYKHLVGSRIINVAVKTPDDFGDVWTTITIEDADGNIFDLELSRDEEGNGPGFIFGLPQYTLPEYRTPAEATS